MRALLALLLLASSLRAQVQLLENFEGDGFGTWQVQGSGFGLAPVPGRLDGVVGVFTGFAGGAHVCSAHGGDAGAGEGGEHGSGEGEDAAGSVLHGGEG